MSRDLEYESKNIGYDNINNETDSIKCKNYELCKNFLGNPNFDTSLIHTSGTYFCMTCGSWFKLGFGWNQLNFKHEEQDCIVCNETVNITVEFPTKCGHYFCCNCTRNILFWDETRYHLNPVNYGCPPCPNGCQNPDKGRQCYCEEYDEIQEKWKNDKPEEFNNWNNDEHFSINNSNDLFFGNKKCPLCRKIYT